MRHQFGNYLLQFKDAPVIHKNKPENTKAVILLDDRTDFWFLPVLKNYSHFLDDTWNFHIVCTDRNYEWAKATLAVNYWKVEVHHIKEYFSENPQTLDLPTYIKFYTTPIILNSFTENIFLTAQFDSLLLSPIKEEYLQWDFIGAPCGEEAKSMNGGCTIRNRDRMVECLERTHFGGEADDVYYTREFKNLGFKVPDTETAVAFAVENLLLKDGVPFGFHGTNKYYLPDPIIQETLNRSGIPQIKKQRIMIGVPVYKWPPHPKFMESIAKCEKDHRFDLSFRSIQGDAHIERARSMLLLQYLQAPEHHDWYVMIDSDIEFNGDIIWGIINRGKDVIGAPYAFKAAEGTDKHQQPVIRSIDGEVQTPEGLLKVRHLGGGFTVISDAFLRKMIEHYKDLEFMMNPDLLAGAKDQKTYGLWNSLIIDQPHWGEGKKEMLSEDYCFCERVWQMGGECWADLSAYIAHWDGEKCYQLKLNENVPVPKEG